MRGERGPPEGEAPKGFARPRLVQEESPMDRRPIWWGAIASLALGLSACSGDIETGGARGKTSRPTDKPNVKPDDPGKTPVDPPVGMDPPPVGADPAAMNSP